MSWNNFRPIKLFGPGRIIDYYKAFLTNFEIAINSRLSPEKIQKYLKDIKYVQGTEILEIVFHYLIFICGKYLQMMVAYHISKEDSESLTSEIQKFPEIQITFLSLSPSKG